MRDINGALLELGDVVRYLPTTGTEYETDRYIQTIGIDKGGEYATLGWVGDDDVGQSHYHSRELRKLEPEELI